MVSHVSLADAPEDRRLFLITLSRYVAIAVEVYVASA